MNDTAHALSSARTLWELVERRARLTPDRPVLLQGDRSLTFGALRERSERVAAGLYERGVRPGTVVAWQLPTRIETALLSFALARVGAVQTPVIPFYRDREVGFALRESKAAHFAVPGEWRGFDHTAMAHRLGARNVFEAYDDLPDGDPAVLPPPPSDGTTVRWIYWTSGTTSDPKGVLHTDRSLIAGGSCLAHALHLSADDVGSMAFPYAHIAGPDYTVMLLLYGFPAVMFEHFALPAALEEYRRHGVTVAGGSTAFYAMFLAEQRKRPGEPVLPALRLLAGGGAPKPPEVYHAVVREMGVQLTHGYGMTEVPMITMGAPDDTAENLATTEGRPPDGMEIRIVDAAGAPRPAGVDGDVRLRGEAVCRGYLDPAQTAEAFDADGFLVTGDVGHLTESGHLVLTGRVKDIIIRKGENISAKEIEDLLHRHPAVGDVAVIGLPDAERGERVCAVVEQPPGSPGLTLAALTSYLRGEGLSVHKLPEQLEVVDALPRNETLRKVLKYRLRERFSA
ncbi:class I adenylate-forming enzyme family protein [Streptomyces sp. NPDC060011]|uniref:class I adenylate-forming enzyme family protein n=1 Tax=unclassified Streptomyces TaxID=2593676 RepID=UPI0013BDC1FF|nr:MULTISPECIES: AMP-binding protein [unclassified Streptomyces]MCX5283980.1 AMP-binding protein [Streptomyces sp. NBC_00198]NEB30424.1 AMP-binding protein [Streptomyces sp. SID14446]WSD79106.1 AMP-binding protein [Streptomyces sp. NBC_01558]